MSNTSIVLKALADETRLGLAGAVARQGGQMVSGCDATAACPFLSSMSQPTLSHHFSKLVAAGVLLESKSGTSKSYQLNQPLLDSLGIDITKLTSNKG